MSAMSFLCPGMLKGVREDVPDAWMRTPSMRRSLAAVMDLDVRSFATQFTAEVAGRVCGGVYLCSDLWGPFHLPHQFWEVCRP
eukprot:5718945-Ditylum_brightwellii.AAC.1